MADTPTSDHDWTIHSLNIHGIFFERWCQETIGRMSPWELKSINYPVEFPPPSGFTRGKESALDLWVQLRRGYQTLNLTVECKKTNLDFVDWIFFPRQRFPELRQIVVPFVNNSEVPNVPDKREYGEGVTKVNFFAPCADEARETRGCYTSFKGGDKTKTSNRAITDAAYQVALATQAICTEEHSHLKQRLSSNPPAPTPKKYQIFIPTIITNAKIVLCEFDPKEVSPETGEIEFGKASLVEKDFVVYEYPLPKHLQKGPADPIWFRDHGSIDDLVRMHILIVNSAKMPAVLRILERDIQIPA
jgi:hypothetical protein